MTDIEVSRSIELRSVAYVKAPDRWERLAAAEADAYVDSMSDLAHAVRHRGQFDRPPEPERPHTPPRARSHRRQDDLSSIE